MRRARAVAVMLGGAFALAGEPQWLAPLTTSMAPPCPEHAGVRVARSETARSDEGTSAFILREARNENGHCLHRAALHISTAHGTELVLDLPEADRGWFSVIGFSPDGSAILLSRVVVPGELFRDVEISSVPLGSGAMQWQNAWDLLGLSDCGATVQPQGYLDNEQIVISVAPPVNSVPQRRNCVDRPGLYRVNLQTHQAAALPDTTRLQRYGRQVSGLYRPCKSDPDIAGACFVVHGRLSAWNGAPTMRIWHIGTKRILGVEAYMLPADLSSRLNWDLEAYGDFTVCPFTKERAGVMQMVCVESAEQVIYRKR